MKGAGMAYLLKGLLNQSRSKEKAAIKRIKELEALVDQLSKQLESLQDVQKENDATIEKLVRELKILRPKKCEKILNRNNQNQAEPSTSEASTQEVESPQVDGTPAPDRWKNAKKRGNNGARRKEYFCSEIQEHDIWPDQEEGFIQELADVIRTIDLIRYEYIPPRFIKHIFHQKICKIKDTVLSGKTPAAPFLHSNFDSSFIAGMLQLRYGYSLPVERIIRLFDECGFDINKSTAHGLLAKAYTLLEDLDEAMKAAVLEDTYINMDESYFTALEVGPHAMQENIKSSKVYVWCAEARHLNLVHFFYEKGSRATKMLTDYIPKTYKGAIQSDGLASYEILETDNYPHALHLTCWQHCKRDFFNIKDNPDAQKIVRTMNKLYREERKIKPEWSQEKKLLQRQKYAPPIFAEIKSLINTVLDKKTTLPKTALFKACNKTLNQFDTLCNYIQGAEYDLDNNAIERTMRQISLSRRSSLFFGSHEGAKRSALFLSLACSCRLHGIDIFEYFKYLIDTMSQMPQKKDPQFLRNLLPDKYKV